MESMIRTRIAATDPELLKQAIEKIRRLGLFVQIESQIATSGKLPEPGIPLNTDVPRHGPNMVEFTISADVDAVSELLAAGVTAGPACIAKDINPASVYRVGGMDAEEVKAALADIVNAGAKVQIRESVSNGGSALNVKRFMDLHDELIVELDKPALEAVLRRGNIIVKACPTPVVR